MKNKQFKNSSQGKVLTEGVNRPIITKPITSKKPTPPKTTSH